MPKQKKLANFKLAGAKEFNAKRKLKWRYAIAEDKFDGLRLVVIVRSGVAKAYTRNGCKVINAKYICREIEKSGIENLFIDGEGVCFPDWNKSASVIKTLKPHKDAKQLELRAFDCLTLSEWDRKKCTMPLCARKQRLKELIEGYRLIRTKYVSHEKLESTPDQFEAFVKARVKQKKEGGVFKDPDSMYAFKKSSDWLKLKPVKELDAKIIDVKWGNKGKTGQMLGLIGSIECKGKIGNKKVTFNSSGMSMHLRKKMTRMHRKGKLIGKIVEVHYDCITVHNKIRFPRFERLRIDKDKS
jgi:ATP-dependent DNA ligase